MQMQAKHVTLTLFHCCDLFQIITRCDVCLLQEVRDSKEKAIPLLVDRLNR